jgi:polysaccharide chain length determinant protein (PEP-CTERM system associated)
MQPTQDLLTIPRRPLDVEDYIDIVRRHKAWIAGPAFLALVAAVVVAFMWPDTYVSEATVQVVPPQVPERFVPSNVNSEMSQRINQMAQNVLKRASLTNVIQSNNLYRSELQRKPMEDVLEQMKKDIKISPVVNLQQSTGHQPISAFRVSFEYSNRHLARKVTQELVNGFIYANISTQSTQVTATTDFLDEQWKSAQKDLDVLDHKLTAFRVANAGRLPDELQSNLTTLRTLEQQLSGINEYINRIGQEKLMLESQIRIYKDQLNALSQPGVDQLTAQMKSERLQSMDHEVLRMESAIASLKERYTATHPDVKAAEAQLALLKSQRDELLKAEQERLAAAPAAPRKINPDQLRGARELEASITSLQSHIQAKDLDMEERMKQQTRLVAMINEYNGRIQSSPEKEREYAELQWDYKFTKDQYEALSEKRAQSQIATNLDKRGQGETLQLLDYATLPETPTKPKRLMIVGAGFGIGLLLGIFIAGAREMKDTSLKNLKDARAYTNLPVLGTIPLLENDLVVRRKRRLTWLAWSAASIVGVVAMTGSIYYYYATRV